MKLSDIEQGYSVLSGGVWVTIPDLPPFDLLAGMQFKSRRLWNPEYEALRSKLTAEIGEEPSIEDVRRIQDECLIQTCICDWRGIDDPYSPDLARKALAADASGGIFRSAYLYAAGHVADAYKTSLEADAKNSLTP